MDVVFFGIAKKQLDGLIEPGRWKIHANKRFNKAFLELQKLVAIDRTQVFVFNDALERKVIPPTPSKELPGKCIIGRTKMISSLFI